VFSADPPPDAPRCAYEHLSIGNDDDVDGVLNEDDACPLVANHEVHDEDGDGTPDACDPCPPAREAGNDLDCDGIGAACDPDDTAPHVMQFFGFGSPNGLVVDSGATITEDVMRFVQGPDTYDEAISTSRVSPDGIYELRADVTGINATGHELGFVLYFSDGRSYQAMMYASTGGAGLALGDDQGGPFLADTQFPSPGTSASFTLRLQISGRTLKLAIAGIATAQVTADMPATAPMLDYGVFVYHPNVANPAFRADIAYFSRTAVKP
jgi:hypothetical protein